MKNLKKILVMVLVMVLNLSNLVAQTIYPEKNPIPRARYKNNGISGNISQKLNDSHYRGSEIKIWDYTKNKLKKSVEIETFLVQKEGAISLYKQCSLENKGIRSFPIGSQIWRFTSGPDLSWKDIVCGNDLWWFMFQSTTVPSQISTPYNTCNVDLKPVNQKLRDIEAKVLANYKVAVETNIVVKDNNRINKDILANQEVMAYNDQVNYNSLKREIRTNRIINVLGHVANIGSTLYGNYRNAKFHKKKHNRGTSSRYVTYTPASSW